MPHPGDSFTIPVRDADGKEPLPICRRTRDWLIEHYKQAEAIVLRFFSDAPPVNPKYKPEEEKAIKHLRECPKCRPWTSTIVSEPIYRRQANLVQYCCAGMYCAVEEHAERGDPQFSFVMFRGEDPCWQINGHNTFASYCPWCGKKLPDHPFRSD